MTYQELAERDLQNAKRNLLNAWNKPNVTAEELKNLHRLVDYKQVVCELMHKEYGNG
jgi:outer membrane protein TolC